MRKFIHILIGLPLILFAFQSYGQVKVSHSEDWFYIEPGTNVHIKGQLQSLPANTQQISNLGNMFISDSVICEGDNKIFGEFPDTNIANIYLNGSRKQIFAGNTNMRFGNLYIKNTYDSLEAWNNVEIYNFIQLDSGNIKMVTSTLDLLNTGRLIGETNEKRVFSNKYGQIHIGRPLISGTSYTDIAGAGLDLTINGNLGTNVDIYRRNHQQLNASNGSVDRYYYFTPQQNGYVSKPNIHYLDSNELHGNDENNLGLYHSESSGSTWLYKSSSVNTTTDKVISDPSLNFVLSTTTMLTLAEQDCDSLPYLHFPKDTIPMCGGAPAFIQPEGIRGMSNLWSTGQMNLDSIQVTTAGTYKVTITNLAGCPNTDSVVVIDAPNPVVNYTVAPVCVGDTSTFKNLTTIASGSVVYSWELGDVYTAGPDTTSDSVPSIVYTDQGTYTSSLEVTSNYGCSASLSKSATVLPYPVVDFTVSSSCSDSALVIVNATTVTPNAGLLYRWDFGNGDTSIVTTPSYVYNTIGTKNIELKATSNGCLSTVTKSVTINANPKSNFTATKACIGNQTVFANTSSIASGSITSYLWTFETGANSTLPNPTYTYGASGIYPVNLRVISADGCEHDTTINVTVNELPTPSFSSATTCMGDSILFVNSSNLTSTYSWDFNNEGTSTMYSPKFVFANSGNKNVYLTETDTNGCIGTLTKSIISSPRPTANFIAPTGCESTSLSFNNTSSTPSGNINYQWDFTNGTTSILTSPSEQFVTANTYQVRLVADVNGCTDTVTKAVVVNPNPVVNLGNVITTCSNTYTLDAQNSGSTYLWSNSSTNQTLTANFNGQYWVEVTNSFSCAVSDTVQVTLNSVVMPNLGADATFCDTTTLDAGYPGATYLWNNSTTGQELGINTSGTYSIQVTDANGCIGYDTIVATVVTTVLPNLGPDLSVCDGIVSTLNPSVTGSYLWKTGETTSTIDVTSTGIHWVDFTDANGCMSRDSISVVYNNNPSLDLGSDGNYCDSANFDITQTNVSYLWENSTVMPIRKVTTAGQYWAELTDLTSGCQTRDTVTVTFSPRPIVTLGNDVTVCSGGNAVFDAQNGGAGNSFSWNVGDTTQTITASSNGSYIAFVTSAQGCVGSDTVQLTVNSPISTDLGDDYVLCKGQTTQLTSPLNGATYQWYFNDSLQASTTQIFTASNFGEYAVVATDVDGCSATDTINLIESNNQINAQFLAKTLGAYEGDTIHFVNVSSPSPYSSHWDFGDGSFSIAEDPKHIYFTQGVYNVTLTVTDSICTSDTTKTITVLPLYIPPVKGEEVDTILNSFSTINLYPNPNNGHYNLEVELLEEGDLHIDCFSIEGKQIFSETKYGREFKIQYNNEHLVTGVYIIRLRVNEEYKTIRFIKAL